MKQESTTYYRLLAPVHKGIIVRATPDERHQYVYGKGWVRSGIMLHYFLPDGDHYERYEEISEAEALASIPAH